MTFSAHFLGQVANIAGMLDTVVIERMADELAAVRERGGRLFILGVGGGAGHAGHAVCDFRKLAAIECYSPSDNHSELTARVNDEGWDTSYSAWLKASRFNGKDCILVFSVGGGNKEKQVSVNLVNAVELAVEVGARIIGVVGRDGGHTAKHGHAVCIIPTVDAALVTPHTEGYQAVVWHLLVSHPKVAVNATKWESVVAAGASR